jgi:predicted MFS family arabinose efflux permease
MSSATIRAPAIASVFLLGISAVMVAGLKPLLVTLYITRFGFSTTHTGLVVAAEMGAASLATIGVAALRPAWRRSLALGGLLLLLGSDLLSTLRLGIVGFAAVRTLAGIGEGAAAGVMAATIAGMRSPDRLMGAYNGLALIVLAGAFPAIPNLVDAYGMRAVFVGLAATTLPALALLAWFPQSGGGVVASRADTKLPWGQAWLALLGTASFYLALGGLWPFISEIGRAAGIDTAHVAATLGVAQLAGAAGSFVPALLGQSCGRTAPLALAVAASVAAVAALAILGAGGCFVWAVPLFLGSAMMVFAYLMGVMAGVDPGGRVSGYSISIQTLGLGLGPVWGGLLATRFGVQAILLVALACLPLSLCFLVPLALRQDGIWRRGAVPAGTSG